MVLNLAILERVSNGDFSKPIQRPSTNCSSPFLKSFLVFLQPVFLSNQEEQEQKMASVLKAYIVAGV